MLRKYVMYAKTKIKPKLYGIDKQKISRFYADIRQKSTVTFHKITLRKIFGVNLSRKPKIGGKTTLRGTFGSFGEVSF